MAQAEGDGAREEEEAGGGAASVFRSVADQALAAGCGLHVAQGHRVWRLLLDWEKSRLEEAVAAAAAASKAKQQQQKVAAAAERVRSVYQRMLAVPLLLSPPAAQQEVGTAVPAADSSSSNSALLREYDEWEKSQGKVRCCSGSSSHAYCVCVGQ